jgi:hypothetical protein
MPNGTPIRSRALLGTVGQYFIVPLGGCGARWGPQELKWRDPSCEARPCPDARGTAHRGFWQSMQEAAVRLRVDAAAASVHNPTEITEAISSFATNPDGGVISFPQAVTNASSKLIVELEMRYRLPGLYTGSVDGSLVPTESVGPTRCADRPSILRGASPALTGRVRQACSRRNRKGGQSHQGRWQQGGKSCPTSSNWSLRQRVSERHRLPKKAGGAYFHNSHKRFARLLWSHPRIRKSAAVHALGMDCERARMAT